MQNDRCCHEQVKYHWLHNLVILFKKNSFGTKTHKNYPNNGPKSKGKMGQKSAFLVKTDQIDT